MRDFHRRILTLAARIVGAHVGHNDVPTDSIPNMIRNVYGALAELAASQPGAGEDDHPHHGHDHTHHHDGQALNHAQDAHRHSAIGQTVFDDHLVCMECGLSMKMLKLHLLTVHALSPDAYRAKWGLPADYPMVAAVYAKLRSSLALESGLGLKPEDRSVEGGGRFTDNRLRQRRDRVRSELRNINPLYVIARALANCNRDWRSAGLLAVQRWCFAEGKMPNLAALPDEPHGPPDVGRCLSSRQLDWNTNRMVDETPILPAHIEDTIQAIAKLHADHRQEAGTLQRFIERLTAWIGRPRFIAALTVVIMLWVAGNVAMTLSGRPPWDDPPFAWLQGALGLLALYVTILILTTQRREDQLAGYREQLTLELAILGEQKSAKIIALLEEMRRDNPLLRNRVDEEAAAMAVAADPQAVLDAIKESEDSPLTAELMSPADPDLDRSVEVRPLETHQA